MKSNASIENSAREAVKIIAAATEVAAKTISTAAEAATQVIATNASEAAKVVDVKNAGDHDLLVVLNTKMEDLKIAVEKLSSKDGLYVLKEDFTVWRNLLVVSMIGTIFLSVILKIINK